MNSSSATVDAKLSIGEEIINCSHWCWVVCACVCVWAILWWRHLARVDNNCARCTRFLHRCLEQLIEIKDERNWMQKPRRLRQPQQHIDGEMIIECHGKNLQVELFNTNAKFCQLNFCWKNQQRSVIFSISFSLLLYSLFDLFFTILPEKINWKFSSFFLHLFLFSFFFFFEYSLDSICVFYLCLLDIFVASSTPKDIQCCLAMKDDPLFVLFLSICLSKR